MYKLISCFLVEALTLFAPKTKLELLVCGKWLEIIEIDGHFIN